MLRKCPATTLKHAGLDEKGFLSVWIWIFITLGDFKFTSWRYSKSQDSMSDFDFVLCFNGICFVLMVSVFIVSVMMVGLFGWSLF